MIAVDMAEQRANRLTRSPGGVLVLDTPGEPIPAAVLSDTEPPPVDEDAAALGEAYERGLREGRDEERVIVGMIAPRGQS
mgnify:CR=1 FL=1